MQVLSVIIVTWNNADTIGACLRSLFASVLPETVETILVDNNSTDDTCAIVQRDFPAVDLIRSPDNLGFARANNLAIGRATAATLLLLNPDIILHQPDAIAQLLDTLREDATIVMAGCRLVFPDGRHQVGDAGFRPTTRHLVVHGLGISNLLPGVHGLFVVRPDRIAAPRRDVDWICGACLMVRRDVARAVGGLDERLFLYAEDAAFGCAVRDLGCRVVYLPQVSAIHLQGVSEAQADTGRHSVRWLVNLIALHDRTTGGEGHLIACLAFALGFAARAAAYGTLAVARPAYRGRAGAMWHYARAACALAACRALPTHDISP